MDRTTPIVGGPPVLGTNVRQPRDFKGQSPLPSIVFEEFRFVPDPLLKLNSFAFRVYGLRTLPLVIHRIRDQVAPEESARPS